MAFRENPYIHVSVAVRDGGNRRCKLISESVTAQPIQRNRTFAITYSCLLYDAFLINFKFIRSAIVLTKCVEKVRAF